MISSKKGEGETKQVLWSTHKENEGVKIWGSNENVKRWKMGTCNSTRKSRWTKKLYSEDWECKNVQVKKKSHLESWIDEDHVIEISDDDDEKEISEENTTVQSDDTLKDVKQEESELNDTNEQEDADDTIELEKKQDQEGCWEDQNDMKIMNLFRRVTWY